MTMNQVRFGLLGIFLVAFAVQVAAVVAVGGKMWPDELQSLVVKLLAIYSVPLGVILGGIFAQPRTALEAPPLALGWTALALAVLWNLLLAWRSISLSLATHDSVGDVIKYWDAVASASSFLVAGALAFFFTKSTSGRRKASRVSSG